MAKPTVDELMRTEFLKKHANEAADWLARTTRGFFVSDVKGFISPAESPLEAAFIVWWKANEQLGLFPYVDLNCQHAVTLNERVYRLDLVLEPSMRAENWVFKKLVGHERQPRVAVELDGHDFHERSKEQVTERNRRDRALQDAGWVVLHFSGSEFNARPNWTVIEAFRAASRRFSDAMLALGLWTQDDHNSFAKQVSPQEAS